MGASIGARLVEANTGNKALHVRAELYPQFTRAIRSDILSYGNISARPDGGTCLLRLLRCVAAALKAR